MSAEMGIDALHLDGNAAAGMLSEVFSIDVTVAAVTCAGCGERGRLAGLTLYGHEMGGVLRCRSCQGAVVRMVRTPTHMWLDASGARSIAIPLTST